MNAEEESRVREHLRIVSAIDRALGDAPAVLALILAAATPAAAVEALSERYGFDEDQAYAVLEMQFRRATVADRGKIAADRAALEAELP